MSGISRRNAIKSVGVVGLSTLAGCMGGEENEENDEAIPTGWSETGSAGYATGQIVATVLDQESDISIDARGTGSAENMRLMDTGELAMGYSNAYLYDLVMRDAEQFEDNPIENKPVQAFGAMAANMFFIAHSEFEMETISDIAGHRATIYQPSVSMYPAVAEGFGNMGLLDKFDERQMGTGDIADAFVNQEVDATLAYNVAGDAVPSWLEEIVSRMDDDELDVLVPTSEEIEAMTGVNGVSAGESARPPELYDDREAPEVTRFNLMYGTYATADEDVLDQQTMYNILSTLHENREQIREEASILKQFGTEPNMFSDFVIPEYPVHPGAVEFYEEQGWWSNEYTET